MKLPAFLNPKRWFAGAPSPEGEVGRPTGGVRPSGVPMGSVKALPVELAGRLFTFENRRRTQRPLVQGELVLPEAKPVRSDLFEDDVELVRRRRASRLIHETRPEPTTPGRHDPELAVNRLRMRDAESTRIVQNH